MRSVYICILRQQRKQRYDLNGHDCSYDVRIRIMLNAHANIAIQLWRQRNVCKVKSYLISGLIDSFCSRVICVMDPKQTPAPVIAHPFGRMRHWTHENGLPWMPQWREMLFSSFVYLRLVYLHTNNLEFELTLCVIMPIHLIYSIVKHAKTCLIAFWIHLHRHDYLKKSIMPLAVWMNLKYIKMICRKWKGNMRKQKS